MEKKIKAFTILGKFLKQFDSVSFMENPVLEVVNELFAKRFLHAIREAEVHNPWFTRDFMLYSFSSLAEMLEEKKLRQWLEQYSILERPTETRLNVGIIMAGNIPLVGFHDLLSVCFAGHRAVVKMSSKDEKIFPVIYAVLCHSDPEFGNLICLSDQFLKNIHAVIATGSDNSSRYFEYYFGKYPHIIRKNRNSVAILTGNETGQEYKYLADDIFLYFGMGCRSISKIFIPNEFNIPHMLDFFETYSYLYNHNKYANNYDYHKAIYLVNLLKHLDTGYLLIKEDSAYSSPVGVLYYEYYNSTSIIKQKLEDDKEKIQCIVSQAGLFENSIGFGLSQRPGLSDYADNSDTLKFLITLNNN